MKRLLRLFPALLLLAAPSLAHAYDFAVDGIYYNITSTSDLTVKVTCESTSYNSYSGDIAIPDKVTYDGTTYAITSIGSSAFRDCTGLTSVTIPDAVTSIDNAAFNSCTSLTSITIPDAVTTIGDYAFRNCSKLTSLTLPVSASYTTYHSSSTQCPFDNTILTDLTITGEGDLMDYAFYQFTALQNVTLSESITSIGKSAFYGCTGLTSITIPEAITSIGAYAFYECASLTSITIPDAVTNIEAGTFYGCTTLTSIAIPNAVTTIGTNAFYGCTGLASVSIGDAVETIGDYAFYDCTGLPSITIPDAVTSIGNDAFYGCTSLESLSIGNAVESIGKYAFYNCSSLTSIIIPDAVTSIGSYAFRNCSQLTSLSVPVSASYATYHASSDVCPFDFAILTDLIITGKGDMRSYAFADASALQNATIGDSVTSIENYAFYGCTSLANVSIGVAVTSIGGFAFYGCTGLADVYSYNATPPTCAYTNCFSNYDATLHVPTESTETYASTSVWEKFFSIVGDIETAVTRVTADAEEAQPTGYYSLSGQRLDAPAENEITIIRYSDGTAKKVFMK